MKQKNGTPSQDVARRAPAPAATAVPSQVISGGPELVPYNGKGESKITFPRMREVKSILPMLRFTQKGQVVEAVYLGTKTEVGPNKSNVHAFSVQGVDCGIWGCEVLDAKIILLQPKPGDRLLIYYDGLLEAKPGQNPAKNIRLFVPDDVPAPVPVVDRSEPVRY